MLGPTPPTYENVADKFPQLGFLRDPRLQRIMQFLLPSDTGSQIQMMAQPLGMAYGPLEGAVNEAKGPLQGLIRFFRGGTEGGAGEWWSTNAQRAASHGPEVHYVDVPEHEAKNFFQQAVEQGSGTGGDAILPPKYANMAKPASWVKPSTYTIPSGR